MSLKFTGLKIIAGILISLIFFSSILSAQSREQKIDEYLNACNSVNNFYGTALVAINGRIIHQGGYGYANLELGVRNTPEMKFLIGSITKQFTATAIMQFYEKGVIDLTAPLTKYLPDYPAETGDKITIHNLLTHTSGIHNYTAIGSLMRLKSVPITLDDLLAAFDSLPLDFEPGTRYSYSNSGYVVLGAIIEKVSGMSYADYIQQNIIDPLGMANSGYVSRSTILKNRVAGYYQDDKGTFFNADFIDMSMPFSAGGIHSTVGNMLIWDQALYSEKILKKSSLEKMFTPYLDNYAYGWIVSEMFGRKIVSHGGGIDGFASSFYRFVDDSVCIVVFSNNISADADQIARNLAAIVFDQPYDIPVSKTPVTIDPALLPQYAGVFKIADNDYRVITLEDGKLFSCRNGGRRIEIRPEADDLFYYDHDNSITLKFIRDDSGKIIRHIIHQGGTDSPADKIEGPESDKILSQNTTIHLDTEILQKYAGDYSLGPGFILHVINRADSLFIQALENPELEIVPYSETVFKNTDAGVEVTFKLDSNGNPVSVVLGAGGGEMTGEKIK